MPIIPEPVWPSTGQQVEYDPSSIASTNMRFTYMTGVLLRLMEAKFSDADNIVNSSLKSFVWAEDGDAEGGPVTSKILIQPSYKYDVKAIQMRPAIYVGRAGGNLQDLNIIGNKALTHLEKNGNYEGESYLKMVAGVHQLMCCSMESMAADQLAEEVFYHMGEYGPAIRKDFMLSYFSVKQLSPVAEIKKDHKEGYVSAVSVEWSVAHAWKLKPIAPILKSVGFLPRAV